MESKKRYALVQTIVQTKAIGYFDFKKQAKRYQAFLEKEYSEQTGVVKNLCRMSWTIEEVSK